MPGGWSAGCLAVELGCRWMVPHRSPGAYHHHHHHQGEQQGVSTADLQQTVRHLQYIYQYRYRYLGGGIMRSHWLGTGMAWHGMVPPGDFNAETAYLLLDPSFLLSCCTCNGISYSSRPSWKGTLVEGRVTRSQLSSAFFGSKLAHAYQADFHSQKLGTSLQAISSKPAQLVSCSRIHTLLAREHLG